LDDLVSTDWLAQNMAQADVVPVDCSWFMPALKRSGREEFLASHIPSARFLDIDAVADTESSAPHMLPNAEEFGRAMEALGINRTDRIVVYDNSPTRTATRGWFMLRHFGAESVCSSRRRFSEVGRGRPPDRKRRAATTAGAVRSRRAPERGR